MTIPTAIGVSDYANKPSYRVTGLEDLDFHIGHDALANSATYSVSYPVRHGMVGLVLSHSFCLQGLSVCGSFTQSCCMQVDNWDYMERFYQQCIFKYVFAHCLCLLHSRLGKIITQSARNVWLQCMTQMYLMHQQRGHQLVEPEACTTCAPSAVLQPML